MKVISIIIKDLKTLLSDRKALAVILLMPLVLMVILSFALKGTFMSSNDWGANKINIAVVKQYDIDMDKDRFVSTLRGGFLAQGLGEDALKELSKVNDEVDPEELFFEDFLGSEEVAKIITYQVEAENKAIELLKEGKISAVVLLPEKFIYDMKINLLTPFRNKIDIRVMAHPDNSINGQVVQSIVETYSQAISSVIIGKNVLLETVMANGLGDNGFRGMKEIMDGISSSLEGIRISMVDVQVDGRKHISSAYYYAAAMLTMFMLFAASHGGRMLLEEKENITYQRMIIAGTPRLGILAGKFLTIFLIAVFQIIIMIIFSSWALKVAWGNVFPVILISISSAFAVSGLGTAVAAITFRAGNYKMANIFETAVIQTKALLGGSFFPIDIMPEIFQKLSVLSVNGIALKAYLKVMMGYGTTDIAAHLALLAGIGALFALLGVLILREKEDIVDAQHNKIKVIKA